MPLDIQIQEAVEQHLITLSEMAMNLPESVNSIWTDSFCHVIQIFKS